MDKERAVALAIRWLLLAFAVWAAATMVDGIRFEGWTSVLLVALILGLLNLYLRPVIFIVTLPLTILTLGLFILVLNALLLLFADWVAGWFAGINFEVDGFGAALLGALIISIVNLLTGIFVKPDRIARDLSGGPRFP